MAVLLALALTGCGDPAPEPAAPTTGVQDVEDVENIVNDLESVVGSAESEVEAS
ncbi:hypothetical protein GCM10009557_92130 [Virgisporangium ochraceum]|uniref:Uncharacterized protein n=1 Tax=Virgisporangium ochraceum TaxID=65505 RepID=A0A8J3ZU46_9ACTN|nr:hypothetical protein Voc01_024520 [Virgisporangium ochraceum]